MGGRNRGLWQLIAIFEQSKLILTMQMAELVEDNIKLNTLIIGTIGITHQPQKEKCCTVNEELENHQNHHWRYTGEKRE